MYTYFLYPNLRIPSKLLKHIFLWIKSIPTSNILNIYYQFTELYIVSSRDNPSHLSNQSIKHQSPYAFRFTFRSKETSLTDNNKIAVAINQQYWSDRSVISEHQAFILYTLLERTKPACIRSFAETNLHTDLQILTQKFATIPYFKQTQIMIDNE